MPGTEAEIRDALAEAKGTAMLKHLGLCLLTLCEEGKYLKGGGAMTNWLWWFNLLETGPATATLEILQLSSF